MEKAQPPTGVKIISILYYIGAVLTLLLGILFLVGTGMVRTGKIPLLAPDKAAKTILSSTAEIGILLIALSILNFFVGKGLWEKQNWARIVAIIFAGLGIIVAVRFMIIQGNIGSNVPNLVINLVIGYYLIFSKRVKSFFTSS